MCHFPKLPIFRLNFAVIYFCLKLACLPSWNIVTKIVQVLSVQREVKYIHFNLTRFHIKYIINRVNCPSL